MKTLKKNHKVEFETREKARQEAMRLTKLHLHQSKLEKQELIGREGRRGREGGSGGGMNERKDLGCRMSESGDEGGTVRE